MGTTFTSNSFAPYYLTQVTIFPSFENNFLATSPAFANSVLTAFPSSTHPLLPKSMLHILDFGYINILLLVPISTSLFITKIMLYQKHQTPVACNNNHLVLFMNLQVSGMVLLVSAGSLMYLLSAVGQRALLVSLGGWLTIGLSGVAWLGPLGSLSCGLLSSSRPAWLLHIVTGQVSRKERRSTWGLSKSGLRTGTQTLLLCSIWKSKSQGQLRIKGSGNRLSLLMGGAEKLHHKGRPLIEAINVINILQ